jgi:calcineurin-like phosphoesterase family protein
MVKYWNETVGIDDTVYFLGDFSLAFKAIEAYSNRLSGIKKIVPGNHDFCHSYHKKSRSEENRKKWISKYEEYGWIVLPEQTEILLDGVGKVKLCHHPYRFVEPKDDKYLNWRPKDDGSILLCGHVHGSWKTLDNMVNVGVDVWDFKPVSEKQIVDLLCSK